MSLGLALVTTMQVSSVTVVADLTVNSRLIVIKSREKRKKYFFPVGIQIQL